MRAEIKGDEKQLIDLEWPYSICANSYSIMIYYNSITSLNWKLI